MKLQLDTDAIYPIFYENGIGRGLEVEVPEELWEKYLKTMNDFLTVRNELQVIFNASTT